MNKAHQQTMDRVYRSMKHVYDATRPLFLAGRHTLRTRTIETGARRVLEVGCGTARNLILLARRMPDARFVGIDISSEMCAYARSQVARHGLADRIEIFEGELSDYLASTSTASRSFDVVLFSFSLSMIPDWWAVLSASFGCVRADAGRILIADFGPCHAWPALARWRLYKNLSHFHVFPRPDVATRLAAVKGLAIREQRLIGGYAMVIEATTEPGFVPNAAVHTETNLEFAGS